VNLLETLGELGGTLLGLSLTIAVLSFVIKDNPLYRLAVHILVGVSAGFTVIVLVEKVLLPIIDSFGQASSLIDRLYWIIPVLFGLFLLLKLLPQTASLGNIGMAVMIGIGASVGLVGAVAGTFIPQIVVRYDSAIVGLVVGLLVALTLLYFFFTGKESSTGVAKMPVWFPYIQTGGKVVITMTLAGLFVGALNTSLVLLVGRIGFYLTSIGESVGTLIR